MHFISQNNHYYNSSEIYKEIILNVSTQIKYNKYIKIVAMLKVNV